jgi:hypothetical protein
MMLCTCLASIPRSLSGRIYSPYSIAIWCVCPPRPGLVSPFSYSVQWDRKGRSTIVIDPYSVPDASKSRTSRLGTDTRRMNAIDNGLLLCVRHHIEFDAHLFSIHPEVGTDRSFLGACLNPHFIRRISWLHSILAPNL